MEAREPWRRLALGVALALSLPAAGGAGRAPGSALEYSVAPVKTPGTVSGVVRLSAPVPRLPDLRVTTDFTCCAAQPMPDESRVAAPDGGLANAVVELEGIASGKPPVPPPRVDQLGCRFVPHVALVLAGKPVRLGNSDPVLHNVHAFAVRGWYSLFNVGLPPGAGDLERAIEVPGPVVLRCDAGHRWMRGFIFAAASPYAAVTDASGRFSIDGVPPGRHPVHVWHETLGEVEGSVDVKAGAAAVLTVEVAPGPPAAWKLETGPP